jgi:hypothetical protein
LADGPEIAETLGYGIGVGVAMRGDGVGSGGDCVGLALTDEGFGPETTGTQPTMRTAAMTR